MDFLSACSGLVFYLPLYTQLVLIEWAVCVVVHWPGGVEDDVEVQLIGPGP
jgi:hypothetical protein